MCQEVSLLQERLLGAKNVSGMRRGLESSQGFSLGVLFDFETGSFFLVWPVWNSVLPTKYQEPLLHH